MPRGLVKGQKQLDTAATTAVLKLVQKFQEMLGAGHIAPPTIVWVSTMAPRVLGRHIVRHSEITAMANGKPAADLNAVIELHRRILTSESTLARVVAHETIHHVDVGSWTSMQAHLALNYADPERGHGPFFRESAKKINGLVGDPSFVTVKSDSTYELPTTTDKSYLLFVFKLDEGRYGYVWATRLGPAAKEVVIERLRSPGRFKAQMRVVTTNDLFWTKGPKFDARSLRVAVPTEKERMAELEALFEGNSEEFSLALLRAPRQDPSALGALPAGRAYGRRRYA
jgi:hypothetical protein